VAYTRSLSDVDGSTPTVDKSPEENRFLIKPRPGNLPLWLEFKKSESICKLKIYKTIFVLFSDEKKNENNLIEDNFFSRIKVSNCVSAYFA